MGEYVRKGSKLYIEGNLQTSTWEDKQSGERKCRTEIIARDIVLLGSRYSGYERIPERSSDEHGGAPAFTGVADSETPLLKRRASVDPRFYPC